MSVALFSWFDTLSVGQKLLVSALAIGVGAGSIPIVKRYVETSDLILRGRVVTTDQETQVEWVSVSVHTAVGTRTRKFYGSEVELFVPPNEPLKIEVTSELHDDRPGRALTAKSGHRKLVSKPGSSSKYSLGLLEIEGDPVCQLGTK